MLLGNRYKEGWINCLVDDYIIFSFRCSFRFSVVRWESYWVLGFFKIKLLSSSGFKGEKGGVERVLFGNFSIILFIEKLG